MIDRIAPTRRPDGPAVGFQQWRSLLFLHWPVAKDQLRPLVPKQLTLDLHDGVAYVGVVPFVMQSVRPWHWWPRRCAFSFLETNVRTYVHYRGRPGVYFFSLDASSRLAVAAARINWNLPYYFARMSIERNGNEITYHTRRAAGGARHAVRYQLGDIWGPSQPDTIEHFLLERYLLFVEQRGRIFAGQVHHAPYPAQQVTLLELEDELVAAAGLPAVDDPPALMHYAAGVDVEVFTLRPV